MHFKLIKQELFPYFKMQSILQVLKIQIPYFKIFIYQLSLIELLLILIT